MHGYLLPACRLLANSFGVGLGDNRTKAGSGGCACHAGAFSTRRSVSEEVAQAGQPQILSSPRPHSRAHGSHQPDNLRRGR